ncbi:hypothetical protein HF264_19615 [Rhizobium leguminosarum]|uniref:hypothetical protein n=1 Tax=Rhizobium leguminosarum TaxID=384 RepID=UPI001C91A05A|nr:hypothetical protein [Rhizobium leguminosarum]MBY2941877.1 hypothetical protein [Rhizobium leguminosarum]
MVHFVRRYENQTIANEIIGGPSFGARVELAKPERQAFDEASTRRELLIFVVFIACETFEAGAFGRLFGVRPVHDFRKKGFG